MEEHYGVIYKITNNINRKCYIGQTIKKNGFDERYSHNIKKNTHNKHLKRSIEKYGIDNFTIEKEFDIGYSKDELNQKEFEYIEEFKSNEPEYGYNIKVGGDGRGKIIGQNRADILVRQGKTVFCKTTCEIFLCVADASEKYDICRATIRFQCEGKGFKKKSFYNKQLNKYLEFEYYNTKYNFKKGRYNIPIICITTKERFISIAEACKYFNIKQSTLRTSFSRNNGKAIINKNKPMQLEFMHLYDYVFENYEKWQVSTYQPSQT